MFPALDVDVLESALKQCDGNPHEAASILLDSTRSHSTAHPIASTSCEVLDESSPNSSEDLLKNYSSRMRLYRHDVQIDVNRNNIWRVALGFIKTA